MNLMDILSKDPPSSLYSHDIDQQIDTNSNNNDNSGHNSHANIDGISNGNGTLDSQDADTTTTTTNGVIYLPTTLTEVQETLTELVLHLFSSELLNEVRSKKLKTSIDNLLESSNAINDSSNGSDSTREDKISLCFEQLSIIENHPSLIIDHFIPKKILLLETIERQLNMSGKVQLFNRIVDALIKEHKPEGYRMIVVSNNVKELELLEGVILGKTLYYRNSGSAKLYEDKRPIPDLKEPSSYKLFVNLISTQQLYNNYIPGSNGGGGEGDKDDVYDLILSFDSKLDVTVPSIEILRSKDDKPCPVLVPVPVFSLEQLVSQHFPEPQVQNFADSHHNSSNPVHKWKVKCINTLAVNLFNLKNLSKDFFVENYGANMERFLAYLKDDPKQLSELLTKYNDQLTLLFSDDKLIKKLHTFYSLGSNGGFDQIDVADYHLLKSRLAESLHLKLANLEKSSLEMEQGLHEKRKYETSRQGHYDDDEDLIAANYRKLQKLNDEASFSERKLGRIDNDLIKQQERSTDIDSKLEKLQEFATRDIAADELAAQTKSLSDLKEELKIMQQEYDKIAQESESTREKYQSSSNQALHLSQKLSALKEQNEKLERKIAGPGLSQLPELIKKDTIIGYETKLNRIKQENQFIQRFFQARIDKLYQERQQLVDNSGSSSRPSNRISRASTPL
ncbi:HDA1 complex subunit 2 [Candida viswanathii]|uniref:HDA1 complex subunit 2 n=1 Tax=Candida viswanathii TaxID=5486 RepID=A0A367YFF7_9ASCO|nr:HDA1 complex subunit 2 [Candida viswanathii]